MNQHLAEFHALAGTRAGGARDRARAAVLRAPLAREDHGRDRAPRRRAGRRCSSAASARAWASPIRCPPTTSISRRPGATDADREVISNINPRGRAPADAAGDVAAAIERILREKKSGRRSGGALMSVAMKIDLPPLKPRALAVRTIPDASDELARAFGLPPGRRALGIITATSRRRALRGARSGDQGLARRRRLREVVLCRRRAPVRAALRRVHRHLRRARSRRDRRRAATPASPTWRTRPGSTRRAGRDAARPVAFFPHVIASVGRYLAPLADIPVGSRARLPDRAAAGIRRGPRRRLQGRRACGSRSGSARRRRRTSAAATWRAICPPARPPRAPSRPPIVDVCARAARARVRARRRRDDRRGRAPRAARRRRRRAGRFQALATGERFAEKPDHLTHLVDDASLVPKTHPRIVAARQARSPAVGRCSTRRSPPTPTARAGWSASWARSSSWRARWSAPR